MIEVDPINQCLSKCRLEWFVPGVEELGSRSWLYCGAVWSAIFGAGTREPVVEPLVCVCVTGKCFLASLARCCRFKLAALGRSGPRGAVHRPLSIFMQVIGRVLENEAECARSAASASRSRK